MNIRETDIEGVYVVETTQQRDHRGWFSRSFCGSDLREVIGSRQIRQMNQSFTAQAGAIRGLHFQHPPHAEMKLIRCLKGRVFDVAVDLRMNSPTFLRWHAEELTSDNRLMVVIPDGCAHGFQTLEQDTELLYLHTADYCPAAEGGFRYDDPKLGIAWPITVTDVSPRDQCHPGLTQDFRGIQVKDWAMAEAKQ